MTPNNYDSLSVDIDLRLRWLWDTVLEILDANDGLTLEQVGAFIRAAYGQGWSDALNDPHGKLAADNGFRVPPKIDKSEE